MNILALDTTGPVLSLALRTAEKTFVFHRELARPHDETLLPQAKRLLARAGLDWEGLQALAVASASRSKSLATKLTVGRPAARR